MIATITEVIQVSRRLVQVILRASARTSRANCARLVFFFGAVWASADAGAMTAAVLAARFFIACGLEPGFLAIGLWSNSHLRGCGRRAPVVHATYIGSGRSGGTRTPGPRF